MNSVLYVQIFWDVVNMVSRGVLECYVRVVTMVPYGVFKRHAEEV